MTLDQIRRTLDIASARVSRVIVLHLPGIHDVESYEVNEDLGQITLNLNSNTFNRNGSNTITFNIADFNKIVSVLDPNNNLVVMDNVEKIHDFIVNEFPSKCLDVNSGSIVRNKKTKHEFRVGGINGMRRFDVERSDGKVFYRFDNDQKINVANFDEEATVRNGVKYVILTPLTGTSEFSVILTKDAWELVEQNENREV